ncbi:sterile alpha motif domain-containing protein 9-like [Haliotis asinina]|uniref:sterile alpha motif domain-containing protein 9-like n=1 Tax=Haliotis asinina TaxID=109174 RepID=UPI003531FF91
MRVSDWNKIKEKLSELHDELEAKDLVEHLYEQRVFTDDDKERIMHEATRKDRAIKLLDILRNKELQEGDVYKVFLAQLRRTQPHLADMLKPPGTARRQKTAATESSKGRHVDYIQNMDTGQLCEFLAPLLKKNNIDEHVLKIFKQEEIDGRVFLTMDRSSMKEVFPDLKFGERVKILMERDEFIESAELLTGLQGNVVSIEPCQQEREYARRFDAQTGCTEKYKKGKILENLQTRPGNMIDPTHHCITLDGLDEDSALETIGWETMKFASACMNDRTNGTIHFGVYDGSDTNHSHGEVLGITLERKDCEDTIAKSIQNCFPSDQRSTASACIHPVKYVDVIDHKEICGYVLEIDVEPQERLVKDQAYFIKDQYIKPHQKGSEQQLFRLKSGTPDHESADGVYQFMHTKSKLDENRKEAERIYAAKTAQGMNMLQQLRMFLCDGDAQMGDIYPILVISPLDKSMSKQEIHARFSFIADIEWVCIFDFDPDGQKRGIYEYLTEERKMAFKLRLTDDFDQRECEMSRDDKLNDDLESSHLKPWIFCNGFEPLDKPGLGVLEWKRKRSEGFKEAVRYFSHLVPKDRAILVYLLLSKEYDVMLEAAEELIQRFQNQWMMLAESDSVAAHWKEQLFNRQVEDRVSLNTRCLTPVKWEEVNVCMKEITGPDDPLTKTECQLTTTTGRCTVLPKNMQNEMCDLEILSATACSEMETMDEEEKYKIQKEEEKHFYEGHPPSWVNFYSAHVLTRKIHDSILENVKDTLKGNVSDNENIGRVTLYHQPGSGGTTTAKRLLWDLKERYRCCILHKYSKESHKQIVSLWEYGEEKGNPVLVMIDNLEEDKLQTLVELLKVEASSHFQGFPGVLCVLLICHRQTCLPANRERMMFMLTQELSAEEKNWFQLKYSELTESFKKQKGPNPKNLLSLNIMKENFSQTYIENTVKEIILSMRSLQEKSLLKYVALLNAYDHRYRGVPVPCFDLLMSERKRITGQQWEKCLSAPLRMLITSTKDQPKSLRVINPLLCKWILTILMKGDGQTLSDVMLEFLYSEFCKWRSDVAGRNLFNILRDIMKLREPTASGKPSTFSRLIQELYDSKDVDSAAEILKKTFEKTSDIFIAQQIARLFIVCENWDQAIKYASVATDKQPNNSYLWDTHGQIYKVRLSKLFETGLATDSEDTKRLMKEAVECAYEGTKRFITVQQLSSLETTTDRNAAGYFGQVDICSSLLDTLSLIPDFKNKANLRMFLQGESPTPTELCLVTEEQHLWLQSLQKNVFTTLRKLDDEADKYKLEGNGAQSRNYFFFQRRNIDRLRQTVSRYFGDEDAPTLSGAEKLTPDKRRRQVTNFGVYSLRHLLQLLKEENSRDILLTICRLTHMNLSNPLPFDCRIAIGSALALLHVAQSESDLPSFAVLLEASSRLYDVNNEDKYIDLEPYLFLLLLHWPTPNRKRHQLAKPVKLAEALSKWKDAYERKYPRQQRSPHGTERPFFFLTKKEGIESVVHVYQLRNYNKASRNYKLQRLLNIRENQDLLQRFEGLLSGNGWNVSVRWETEGGNKLPAFTIPLHTRESRQSLRNKHVSFVIGFGWSGPKACDVQTDSGNRGAVTPAQNLEPQQHVMSTVRCVQPALHTDVGHLIDIKNKLRQIQQLKHIPRNQLHPQQLSLMRQEATLLYQKDSLLGQRREEYMGFV